MLFQVTAAGRALIDANPSGVRITRADFGSGDNYVPLREPTALQGSVVYSANAVFEPTIVNTNTLRYSVFIPGPVGPFTFGEVALYAGSTLFGLGAQVTKITKATGSVDNAYRLDVFVDLNEGQHFAAFEVVSSETRNFFPRVPSVDALVAPHYDTNNAYVVYGTAQAGESFMAYSDPTGIWSFTTKPHVWFEGTVTTIGDQGLQSNDLLGAEYTGNYSDLVLQFISGPLRGWCRKVTDLTSNGAILWNTLLLESTKVQVGDQFIVSGPAASVGFTGFHNNLSGLQGGTANERYHLDREQHQRVLYPRLNTQVITGSTYLVNAADDDKYLEIKQDCTVSIDSPSLATYPIGGLSVFRVIESVVTFQGINGSMLAPLNPTVVDCGGRTVTFAIVRRSVTNWDLVAPVNNGSSGVSGGRNVSHSYTLGGRSNRFQIPMYSDTGTETGPEAQIETTRLSMHDRSVRLYPGSLNAGENWTAPALLSWPLPIGENGASSTALPNTTAMLGVVLSINGVNYTIQAMGSSMQTYTQMCAALNASAAFVLPQGTALVFSVVTGQILMVATSQEAITTMTVTSASVFDAGSPKYWNPKRSISSEVNAVADNALCIDQADGQTSQVRSVGQNSIAMGFRSRVKGIFSAVLGGRFTSIEGDNSLALGVDGGFLHADRSVLIGGAGNVVSGSTPTSTTKPREVVIVGGRGNVIRDSTSGTPINSVISASRNAIVTGANVSVDSSEDVQIGGPFSVVQSSKSVMALVGNRVGIIGGENLTMTGRSTVVLYQHDLSIDQDSALFYPTRSNVTNKGQIGSVYSVHTSALGANANLILTTDGSAYDQTNAMQVPNGCSWMFQGTVSANKGGTQAKGWNVSGMVYNAGGVCFINGLNFEIVGETSGAINWELDLIVDTNNTKQIYFALNTAAASTGVDTVSVSAFITINSSRPF